jgi:hypothetical protein
MASNSVLEFSLRPKKTLIKFSLALSSPDLLHKKQLTNTKIQKKKKKQERDEDDEDDTGNDNNKKKKLSQCGVRPGYTPLSMWVPLPRARVTYPFPPHLQRTGIHVCADTDTKSGCAESDPIYSFVYLFIFRVGVGSQSCGVAKSVDYPYEYLAIFLATS